MPHPSPSIRDEFNATTNLTVGTGGFTVSGNRLRVTTTSTFSVGRHIAGEASQDQYCEILVTTQGSGGEAGAGFRMDTSAGTGYVVHSLASSGVVFLEIQSGWSVWNRATFTATPQTPPFWLRVESIGDGVYAYVNGQLLGTMNLLTVPSIATNYKSGTPGVVMWSSSSLANSEIETWEAGPLPGGYVPGTNALMSVGRSIQSPRSLR